MSYDQITAELHAIFGAHDFAQLLATRQQRTHSVHRCASGAEITVHFPGYKAQLKPFRPDYRVDITKPGHASIPLSHANLIVDIYNKVRHGHMSADALRQALLEQLCDCSIGYEQLAARLPYVPTPPPQELIQYAQQAHLGKQYRGEGNAGDLTLEELFCSIKWISIQEDFNYPMPRYQGRKMPYARYLEAIHVAGHPDGPYTLAEVIQRALAHARPAPWPELDTLGVASSAVARFTPR